MGVKRLQFNVNSEQIALLCQENSDVSDGRKSEEVGVKRLQFKLPRAIKACTVEQPVIETFEALACFSEYENFQPSQTAPTQLSFGDPSQTAPSHPRIFTR